MPDGNYLIEISLRQQKLYLKSDDKIVAEFAVSTSINGAGEKLNSECTPCGRHVISEMIGDQCATDTIFVGRRPTGEIYTTELRQQHPARDWILTRILRLEGMEDGVNRGGEVDTFERMIYIHGSPDDVEMGVPGSHGCIRMRNQDVINLFERVQTGTEVDIYD